MATTIVGTSGPDHLSGTSGPDILVGGAGVDSMFGGAGNDAFLLHLSDMNPALNSANSYSGRAQDFIYDFGGAGGWSASNNDFLALAGFGAGSTLTFATYGSATDHTLQFYTIHSTTTGLDYTLFIHSIDGNKLVAGDFAFY